MHASARSEAGIFKCPGNPVVYTTDARTAAYQGCATLGPRSTRSHAAFGRAEPGPAVRASTPTTLVASLGTPGGVIDSSRPGVIPKSVQAERDRDRYAILQAELTREQDKLVRLKTKLNAARATPADAKTDVSQLGETELAIERSEGDIAALGRELKRAMR
jgi:hypothetical protein